MFGKNQTKPAAPDAAASQAPTGENGSGVATGDGAGQQATKIPTRADLDAAIGRLPGDYTDPEFVVNGMRAYFGDVFTDDDEAKVRELVKPAPLRTKITLTHEQAAEINQHRTAEDGYVNAGDEYEVTT